MSSSGWAAVSDPRSPASITRRARLAVAAPHRDSYDVNVSWAPALDDIVAVSGQHGTLWGFAQVRFKNYFYSFVSFLCIMWVLSLYSYERMLEVQVLCNEPEQHIYRNRPSLFSTRLARFEVAPGAISGKVFQFPAFLECSIPRPCLRKLVLSVIDLLMSTCVIKVPPCLEPVVRSHDIENRIRM